MDQILLANYFVKRGNSGVCFLVCGKNGLPEMHVKHQIKSILIFFMQVKINCQTHTFGVEQSRA